MKIVPVRCEKVDAGREAQTQAWTGEWVQVKTWGIFCVSFHLDGNAQMRGAVVGADVDAARGVRCDCAWSGSVQGDCAWSVGVRGVFPTKQRRSLTRLFPA